MSGESDAYRRAGVDYTTLDAAKRRALEAARSTSSAPQRLGVRLLEASRGEPAVVLEVADERLGFVLECLGTKSLIAAALEGRSDAPGEDHWFAVGYDTVAAAVNDCVCVGALPFVVNAYFATGAASFYEGTRAGALVEGFAAACRDAGAAWGGGESPTLAGLVEPGAIDLAAAAIGRIPAGVEPITGAALVPGDEIVLVASTGLHANGASLVRDVAGRVEGGFGHRLASGATLGSAVMRPSALYVGLVESLLGSGLPVHYLSHITGHGLRKVMRAERRLTYRIHTLPEVPEVLAFVAKAAGLSARDAYGTLNMGVGFACFVGAGAGAEVAQLAGEAGHAAVLGGVVEEGGRAVVLEPLGVGFADEELDLR